MQQWLTYTFWVYSVFWRNVKSCCPHAAMEWLVLQVCCWCMCDVYRAVHFAYLALLQHVVLHSLPLLISVRQGNGLVRFIDLLVLLLRIPWERVGHYELSMSLGNCQIGVNTWQWAWPCSQQLIKILGCDIVYVIVFLSLESFAIGGMDAVQTDWA